MNEEYGVDFIARCIAAEALEKAEEGPSITVDDTLSTTSENPVQNKVITNALNNIEIDVDNALSTTSENPVQNKVITVEVNAKPTCVNTSGTKVNGQKIMELTKTQYDAIQNKDSDTYYMITDDIASGAYTGGTGIEIENYEISIDEDVVATKTWVGNQGYLTSANEVPTVGVSDNGRILTANYSGNTGTYSWQDSRQVPNPTSSDVDKYLKATAQGAFSWQAGPTGVPSGTQSDIGKVLTYGSSGAEWSDLPAVDEVPDVTAVDSGKVLKSSYNGGVGSYSWQTISEVPDPASGDLGKVLTAAGSGVYGWADLPSNLETTTNKVTSLSSASTDTQYPSAKCVYDLVGNIQTVLASLTTPVSP